MTRSPAPVLSDIMDAVAGVEHATNGMSYEQSKADWLVRHAVQRASEIIPEACRHLPDALIAPYSDVPWAKIRASGNVLRHE